MAFRRNLMAERRYVIRATYKDSGKVGYVTCVHQQGVTGDTVQRPKSSIALFTNEQAALCYKMKIKDWQWYLSNKWTTSQRKMPFYEVVYLTEL